MALGTSSPLHVVWRIDIAGGRYANDSEAILDLIRRDQERGLEMESVRQALIEGEQSAEPEPFDVAAFKRRKTEQGG